MTTEKNPLQFGSHYNLNVEKQNKTFTRKNRSVWVSPQSDLSFFFSLLLFSETAAPPSVCSRFFFCFLSETIRPLMAVRTHTVAQHSTVLPLAFSLFSLLRICRFEGRWWCKLPNTIFLVIWRLVYSCVPFSSPCTCVLSPSIGSGNCSSQSVSQSASQYVLLRA